MRLFLQCDPRKFKIAKRVSLLLRRQVAVLEKTATSVDENIWKEVKKDFIAHFEATGGGD